MRWCKELEQLTEWWQTPVGNLLLQAELTQLEKYLEQLFGYKLLLLAPSAFETLSTHSRMGQVLRIDPMHCAGHCAGHCDGHCDGAQIMPNALPTNIDAIIIPHLLSYLTDAADCIKHCWQSLDAHGQLIITGYRRCSYLGWSRLCHSRLRQQVPNAKNSKAKIMDLLQENSFLITKQEIFAPMSLNTEKVGLTLLANNYVIAARKELVLSKITEPLEWQKKRKISSRMVPSGCQRERN